jgi:hypothetical protein
VEERTKCLRYQPMPAGRNAPRHPPYSADRRGLLCSSHEARSSLSHDDSSNAVSSALIAYAKWKSHPGSTLIVARPIAGEANKHSRMRRPIRFKANYRGCSVSSAKPRRPKEQQYHAARDQRQPTRFSRRGDPSIRAECQGQNSEYYVHQKSSYTAPYMAPK